MEKIYLYGAGGHAKVIIDVLKSRGIMVSEIFDDNPNISMFMDIPIVHNTVKSPIIVSIGDNRIRKKIVDNIEQSIMYSKALAKSAIISESAKTGEGSVVMQGAIIQSSTIIGKHTIVNTGSTIDHDCFIHDFVHIAPGVNLCGSVEVGEGSLIGAGSIIIPGIKIGNWCTIGAGSVVTKDIPDHSAAVGNPARIIKTQE